MSEKRLRSQRRPLRRLLFVVLMLALVYGVVELVSFVVWSITFDEPFSMSAAQVDRKQIILSEGRRAEDRGLKIVSLRTQSAHPYVGYVLDPSGAPAGFVNGLGFPGPQPPLDRSTLVEPRHSVSVCMLGGSVAFELARGGLLGPRLKRHLDGVPGFQGKDVHVYTCCFPTVKQPQQLMMFNWLLSLDAHFDLVINLDGFNEITLSVLNNVRRGVFAHFPRRWDDLVEGLSNPDLVSAAGAVESAENERVRLAYRFSNRFLRRSITANVIWKLLDRGKEQALAEVSVRTASRFKRARTTNRSFAAVGPARTYASDDEMYADLVAVWRRSSRMIDLLARGHGARYFHFLQPNQYVPDSKIMTAAERAVAYSEGSRYRPCVIGGYPRLIEAGKSLIADGVAYVDLTMLFRGNDEVLYTDDCCHVNGRGNEIMGERIAAEIGDALKR